jgi:hypothetical protein
MCCLSKKGFVNGLQNCKAVPKVSIRNRDMNNRGTGFAVTLCAALAAWQPAFAQAETPCTATESALHAAFVKAGMGIMGANNRVIAVSNAPSTQVTSRDPHTYRIHDPAICAILEESASNKS